MYSIRIHMRFISFIHVPYGFHEEIPVHEGKSAGIPPADAWTSLVVGGPEEAGGRMSRVASHCICFLARYRYT